MKDSKSDMEIKWKLVIMCLLKLSGSWGRKDENTEPHLVWFVAPSKVKFSFHVQAEGIRQRCANYPATYGPLGARNLPETS